MTTDFEPSAFWCWPVRYQPVVKNFYAYFRRSFELKSLPAGIVNMRISADARYTLKINGHWVHHGPARSSIPYQSYDEIDISRFLITGANVIDVICHQYGRSTFFYTFRDISGLLVDGKIANADEIISLATPENWQCRSSSAWRQDVVRHSIQLGYQEHYDARLETDEGWHEPVKVAKAGKYPWLKLEPRQMPLLANHIEIFQNIVAVFSGASHADYEHSPDTYHLPQLEKHIRDDAILNTLKDICYNKIVKIPATGSNGFLAVVLDPCAYRSGMFMLDIADAVGGEIVDILYSQAVDESGFPVILGNMSSAEGCQESFGDRYICRSGNQQWETFHYNGMRYVTLIFRRITKPITLNQAAIRVIHADVPMNGDFTCDDDVLNRIWQAGKHTQINCLFDAFEDCPWREQAMWWGDARIQAAVTKYAFGDDSVLARGIRLMVRGQAADGAMHAHPPTDFAFHYLPDFMMTWVSSLHDYYWQTGDLSLLHECRPALHRLMEFFSRFESPDKLIGGMQDYWIFLDWAPLFKNDYSALLNLLYLQALRHAEEVCTLTGDSQSALYHQKAADLQKAIESHFYDADSGLWHDGFDAIKKQPVKILAQQTHALAVILGLKPESHARIAQSVLLQGVCNPQSGIIESTPFFYAYVLDAISRAGFADRVAEVIRQRWGAIMTPGITTFPSQWPKPGQQTAGCHAWSSSPVYHVIQCVLGITPIEPGWRKIRINPKLGNLRYARASVPTRSGMLHVDASQTLNGISLKVEIPSAITGDICVNGDRHIVSAGIHQWP